MTINAYFHAVITVKYRRKILNEEMNRLTKQGFENCLEQTDWKNKVEIVRVNYDNTTGKNDHVHVLFRVKDFTGVDINTLMIGGMVHSRRLILDYLVIGNFQWSKEYYIKTISPVLYTETLIYIEHQNDEERAAIKQARKNSRK